MGMNAVKVKIMPSFPETNLEEVKGRIREKIEVGGGKIDKIEEKDIAFGLKALIVFLAWPEDRGSDEVENLLGGVEGVGSVEVEDVRRAFG